MIDHQKCGPLNHHVTTDDIDGYVNDLVGIPCMGDFCDAFMWELIYTFGKLSTLNRPNEAKFTQSKALLRNHHDLHNSSI